MNGKKMSLMTDEEGEEDQEKRERLCKEGGG